MTNLANVTEEALESWFGDLNVKGWVMTIQGHPAFAIHKGPPGVKLLSEDAYDKHGNSSIVKSLQDLAHKQKYVFIYKSSKLTRYVSSDMINMLTPINIWNYKNYKERYGIEEKITKSDVFKRAWERCAYQVRTMNIQAGTKKSVAVKYIHEMFDPIYQGTKRKFKLSDDECLQAFEDAIELLKVKMVMNA